jgi:WD40 repeat protein
VWDLHDAKKARTFAKPGWFNGIRFADSRRLVAQSVTGEGYASIGWDLETGDEIPDLLPELAWARAFHPDGRRFLEGWSKFHQWDAVSGKLLLPDDAAYSVPVAVRFDATGERLITHEHRSLNTWKIAGGKRIRSLPVSRYPEDGPNVVLSADGSRALVCRRASETAALEWTLWDVARQTAVTLDTPAMPRHSLRPIFAADGSFVAVRIPGLEQPVVRIWDVKTGDEMRGFPDPKGGAAEWMFSVAGGATLVVAGTQIVGIDAASGKELFAWTPPVLVESPPAVDTARGPRRPASGPGWSTFAMSPDGETAAYILCQCSHEPIRERIVLCDGKTGRLLRRLDDTGRPGWTAPLEFSPDGRRLVSVRGKEAYLWDVATGAKLRTFAGHRGDISAVAFSERGDRLATASRDTTVLVWKLPE